MQEADAGVRLGEGVSFRSGEAKGGGVLDAVGFRATGDGKGVLDERWRSNPLEEQGKGPVTMAGILHSTFVLPFPAGCVKVEAVNWFDSHFGFLRAFGEFLQVADLTVLLPGVNLGTSHVGVIGHARGLCSGSARTTQFMATMMASVEQREVLRCDHCSLVQFRTISALCRRCHRSVVVPIVARLPPPLLLVPALPARNHGIEVSHAVRDLRLVRNLSQRQLAARMGVPRTYISKIENGKATPTLSSLRRLADALEVDMSALLRDAPTRHRDEAAMLMADPFLAEIAAYASKLDPVQRSIFLNHVRDLASGHRRSA